jgi:hypothetical protein
MELTRGAGRGEVVAEFAPVFVGMGSSEESERERRLAPALVKFQKERQVL